ncbi:MAG TPA: ribosome silencing factor [Terriglobales bacterium]|nr:ribosome silencing factor [Terriglobales bacterium]
MAKKTNPTMTQLLDAVQAAEAKKAEDIAVLEMDKASGAFTDYFVICSGSNPRQIQAISDEVEERLGKTGVRPAHVEGYSQADWVLLDYVDFVVHVFSPKARNFYNLERLWKSAKRYEPTDLTATVFSKRSATPTRRTTSPSRKKATHTKTRTRKS